MTNTGPKSRCPDTCTIPPMYSQCYLSYDSLLSPKVACKEKNLLNQIQGLRKTFPKVYFPIKQTNVYWRTKISTILCETVNKISINRKRKQPFNTEISLLCYLWYKLLHFDFVEPVEKQSIYEKARMCNAFGSSYQ